MKKIKIQKSKMDSDSIEINKISFSCEGTAGGSLGHPKVYLHFPSTGHMDCPYCGAHYVYSLDESAHTKSTIK